jgi:hypothetical protein
MNLSQLASCSPSCLTALGSSEAHQKCSTWGGSCQKCSMKKSWLDGIFCANFTVSIPPYPTCHSVWCGRCYTSNNLLQKFHIHETESFTEGVTDSDDLERLQAAWKGRHQPAEQYTHGRDGDNLITPFECDVCIFRKLRRHLPDTTSLVDCRLLECIRRVNLDSFWSRASSTVKGNLDRVKSSLQISYSMGLGGPYFHDYCGYKLAIQMVDASRKPGRYSQSYTQFDTIRKYRSPYASFARTTPQGNRWVMGLVNANGHLQRFVQDPTVTVWFQQFITGCERRMGNVWRPNVAFPTPLLLKIFEVAEARLNENISDTENDRWIVFLSYCAVMYTLSLSGDRKHFIWTLVD